ncbi:hypothetical protein R50072_28590 [Simiduia litorea]|uniref:3-hydroxyacyl-ACP dehydratase FabZ family protein n=1 Tax=Halorubrum tibetense TaxID=175631 RepID=A0ABD5SFC6_9EURY
MIDLSYAPTELPQVLDLVSVDSASAELTLQIQPALVWFQGHFPQTPILPGVVQLNWVRIVAARLWQEHAHWLSTASQLEAIKFQQVIRPGDTVQLHMQLQPDRRRVQFTYFSDAKVFASGRLVAAL